MNITEQQLFAAKKLLQEQIAEYETKLQELIQKQANTTNIEVLAHTVLEYNVIQQQINDRAHIFSLLSAPPQSLRSPFIKSELFSYLEAAETVGPQLVDLLINDFIAEVRSDMENQEDNSVDLIEAEYKEYILPGKMMAERFDEIDGLTAEMIRFCKLVDPQYNESHAEEVLTYAFRCSIDADTRMEPTIQALQKMSFTYLTEKDRAALLDHVEEHLAILRFTETKNQNLAMEEAIRIREEREKH